MSGANRDRRNKKCVDESSSSSLSDVDQLLQAAEDQLLLNLPLNNINNDNNNFSLSSSSSSSSCLDSVLSRRFDALKSPLKPNPNPKPSISPNPNPNPSISPNQDDAILSDDLARRFAALKGPNLNPSPNPSLKNEEEEEDEVEKLMQWAKDAARLDPSKSDDDDDDDGIDDDDNSDDSDDDLEREKGRGKEKGKPKTSPQKNAFF